jgi:hypothetical protein
VIFFGGLAMWHWLADNDTWTAAVLVVVAATIGLLGLVAPSAVRPVFVGSLVLAFPIGWVMTRVLLVLMFTCLITPVALLFRMSGRDILGLKRRPEGTYWVAKPAPSDLSSYFRQF